MPQGIVRVTPTSPGKLVITRPGWNFKGVKRYDELEFDKPDPPVALAVWDVVQCKILSKTKAKFLYKVK